MGGSPQWGGSRGEGEEDSVAESMRIGAGLSPSSHFPFSIVGTPRKRVPIHRTGSISFLPRLPLKHLVSPCA